MAGLSAAEPEMVNFSPSDSVVEKEEEGMRMSFGAQETEEREERETALEFGRLQELEVDVERVVREEGRPRHVIVAGLLLCSFSHRRGGL